MRLTATELTKAYRRGGPFALGHVGLSLGPGIHGLLGRNGAGRSILFGIIANRLLPSGGEATLDGVNVRDDEWS